MTQPHAIRPARVPVNRREAVVPTMSDQELEWELTLAAGARTATRRHLFDALLSEVQRRRRNAR
jgi:hypothetical protein